MAHPTERIQKILSRAGIASRRKAEALILAGKVEVNGRIISELGAKADPHRDTITVEGRPIQVQKNFHYYAYYKPRGIVVSKKDELGRRGIFEILDLPPEVNAVGRLDKDSEGLLLLTDDGDFIQRYTHPSFQVPKRYHVQISRPLTAAEIRRLMRGIELDGKKVRATQVKNLKIQEETWVALELREGIKREIRRMMDELGVKIHRLIRVKHGSVGIRNLRPGDLLPLPRRPR